LFEQLAAVRVADEERTRQLRHRYLALIPDALGNSSGSLLPGPPRWEEIDRRWESWSSPAYHLCLDRLDRNVERIRA
jgi:hypothetical protein